MKVTEVVLLLTSLGTHASCAAVAESAPHDEEDQDRTYDEGADGQQVGPRRGTGLGGQPYRDTACSSSRSGNGTCSNARSISCTWSECTRNGQTRASDTCRNTLGRNEGRCTSRTRP